MSKLSRRTFIAGAAVIPFSIWFQRYAGAQTVLTRYEASTAQGKAMLQKYARAVTNMKTVIAEGNPLNWGFQWYTHWVKGSTTKSAELARIYPSPSPSKSLATEMWNTCQNHSNAPGRENYFLPWHRMYVYFFERIIRKACGDASFTLPYWNYSVIGPAHGVIPDSFRKPGDPTFGSLFVADRNTGVNNGVAIDSGQPAGLLSLDSLKQCTYEPVGNAIQGFCLNLDANLHGNVHGLTGNSVNMGSVRWAANDPVFWAHHSNIDRIWASWNKGGRTNPTSAAYLNESFVFADENGNRVVATVKDFLDISKLYYTYDRFEPVPACPSNLLESVPMANIKIRATVPTGRIELGAEPVKVSLNNIVEPTESASLTFSTRVDKLKGGRRIYIVVSKLSAQAQPGVLYHIYLELPANATADQAAKSYAGSIQFFDAAGHEDGSHNMGDSGKFFSFDITNLSKGLQKRKLLTTKPTVTIVPSGTPVADAKPVIGDISVIEQ